MAWNQNKEERSLTRILFYTDGRIYHLHQLSFNCMKSSFIKDHEPYDSLRTLVLGWSPDELFCSLAMSPLPGIYDPEDQRQHNSSRNHHQTNVDPFTVFLQAGAILSVDCGKCISHKSTVFKLNQEWGVMENGVAQVYSGCHLVV